jgi:hypothetical protein
MKPKSFSFSFRGNRKELERLIRHIEKKYNGRLVTISGETDLGFFEHLISLIPYFGKYIVGQIAYVFMEVPKDIRKKCWNCGFPANDGDLEDKGDDNGKVWCMCCASYSDKYYESQKKKEWRMVKRWWRRRKALRKLARKIFSSI